MGDTTPRVGLLRPGGGSTGTHGTDDVADIDGLNGNFDKIDTALFPSVANIAALVALSPSVPIGAIVSVRQYLLTATGSNHNSAWIYMGSSTWMPLSIIHIASTAGTADEIAVLAQISASTGLFIPAGTYAESTYTGYRYRYNGTTWKPWDSDWAFYGLGVVGGFAAGYNQTNGWNSNLSQYRYTAGKVRTRGNVFTMSNGSVTGQIALSLPVVPDVPAGVSTSVLMNAHRNSPSSDYILFGFLSNNGNLYTGAQGFSGQPVDQSWPPTPSHPFAWAQSDIVSWDFEYDV